MASISGGQVPGWTGPVPDDGVSPIDWNVGTPAFVADDFDRDRRASPWAGHRWFAYDLIQNTRPDTIVELGTHYGCSLFAFLQAVADGSLDTKVVAVDTWQGDEHAGFYEDVYELVASEVEQYFGALDVHLWRTTFEEAAAEFTGTVDLLHIDGFHTFEAAQSDYETWLPHLSSRATVLFHDVDPASGYGSADFWRQLAEKDGGFTFLHSFGLGVLTRDEHLARWLASPEALVVGRLYERTAAADLSAMQTEDLTKMVEDGEKAVASMNALVEDRDAAVVSMTAMVDERDAAVVSMTALVDDRDAAITSMTAMIDDRDAAIASMTTMIDERDALITSLHAVISERDQLIASLKAVSEAQNA